MPDCRGDDFVFPSHNGGEIDLIHCNRYTVLIQGLYGGQPAAVLQIRFGRDAADVEAAAADGISFNHRH